ncbi:isocitrate lyase/PEP mutase family protein [Fodinicola acaciae]|uniref:isocitrate lyase/PEP mutase family protein n=1 Tax=Fodinicola acaciae TaxID=2681555 RepID=UPI0013D27119|nr:isocitrate lyase/phosphoenolpyruvate mutase family protein [Fodinicola acaciae]
MTVDFFRSLHRNGQPLVLPNCWDAASARVIESAGAAAIATTSAGVAWSLGAADGNFLTREAAIALVSRVAEAVSVPVTADIEAGFADSASGVADTVKLVADAGAVGVNIEDGVAGGLRPVAEQVARYSAAASAGVFVNARIDTYLRGVDNAFEETLIRARAYVEAGVDGIFVPGVADLDVIKRFVEEISVPVNVMVGPGAPSVDALAGVGVARVSAGSAISQAAYQVAFDSARELLGGGTMTAAAFDYGGLNTLLGR